MGAGMSDYQFMQRCTDEELNKLFDDVIMKGAFSRTPTWKQWTIGIAIAVGFFSGIGSMIEVLTRSSVYEQCLMVIGILSVFALWHVFSLETSHTKLQKAIRRELERRQGK